MEIPAGGINEGEDFCQAAVRELEEETGYVVEDAQHLLDIYTTVAFCNEKIGIYCGKVEQKKEQHLDADEFFDCYEYDLDELLQMIEKGTIQDSKTVSALLAYARKRSQK